jgi:hypothetical protein
MKEYRPIPGRISVDHPGRVLDRGCGYGQVADLRWQAGLTAPRSTTDLTSRRQYGRWSAAPLSIHASPEPRQLPFAHGAFEAD